MESHREGATRLRTELVRDPEGSGLLGRVTLRVRYSETDQMGIVYNAHYLTWFEIGRTEFMRSLGLPYRSVEERGLNLPLVEATLRLRAPIRYDDLIAVETKISRLRSRMISFDYRVLHQEAVIAEGTTIHATVRARDNRAIAIPAWLRACLAGEDRT